MIKPIFKSEELQFQFERDGFVLVRDLIPLKIVARLRQLYLENETKHKGNELSMHSTAHCDEFEMLANIHYLLEKLTKEYADKYLINYKFYLGNFLVKENRHDSLFNMHQDWTCVDEPDYCSFNYWMDLEGMDEINGQLFVLKGTHKLCHNIRFAPSCPTPWGKITHVAPYFYTYLKTNPGDVVFLNNAVLHGSVVNRSSKNRIAAVLGAYSADAKLLHYYKPQDAPLDKVERWIVTTESLINMPRGKRPPGAIFDGYQKVSPKEVSKGEFINFMVRNSSFRDNLKFFKNLFL